MFSKLAIVSYLAILAVATPTPGGSPPPPTIPASQCNTGPIQCCNSSGYASDSAIAGLLTLVGVVIQDLTVFIGGNCSPISGIGIGGNSCSASPLCCENNSFHGVVAIGCVPVNLSL